MPGVNLVQNLERLGLLPERILPLHSRTVPCTELLAQVGRNVALDNIRFNSNAVPEPGSLALALCALLAAGLTGRQRIQATTAI